MLSLNVNIEPALEKLNRLEHLLQNPKPIMDDIGALMVDLIDRRFETSTEFTGKQFKELSPSTLKSLRKGRIGARPLVDTGALQESINYEVINIGNAFVQVGTDVFYGKFHQYGTVNLDSRSFLPNLESDLSSAVTRKLAGIADKHMLAAIE